MDKQAITDTDILNWLEKASYRDVVSLQVGLFPSYGWDSESNLRFKLRESIRNAINGGDNLELEYKSPVDEIEALKYQNNNLKATNIVLQELPIEQTKWLIEKEKEIVALKEELRKFKK